MKENYVFKLNGDPISKVNLTLRIVGIYCDFKYKGFPLFKLSNTLTRADRIAIKLASIYFDRGLLS